MTEPAAPETVDVERLCQIVSEITTHSLKAGYLYQGIRQLAAELEEAKRESIEACRLMKLDYNRAEKAEADLKSSKEAWERQEKALEQLDDENKRLLGVIETLVCYRPDVLRPVVDQLLERGSRATAAQEGEGPIEASPRRGSKAPDPDRKDGE